MRLRRSLHFVPGANEKMMGKALNLSADALIFDLEDSVTPEAKLAAREAVCEWLDENRECRQEPVWCLVLLSMPLWSFTSPSSWQEK